ncbi:MAG: hypothetical protein ABUL41_01945 [Chitinophagaceae bacterium]
MNPNPAGLPLICDFKKDPKSAKITIRTKDFSTFVFLKNDILNLLQRIILLSCLIAVINISALAQPPGWIDPALNHNKLIQQQTGDGGYQLIGPYKVTGTQFLFGEKHKGDIFSTSEKAFNIFLSYNTYNQELGFYSTANPDKALMKEPGMLDSFIIKPDIALGIPNSLKFIYGSVIGAKDKFYYQELYSGKRYGLYKKYKSDLGYVSSNYVQSELRQFDLQIEYYYYNAELKTFTKLKFNLSNIIKEFKSIKDLSVIMDKDAWAINPEEVLKKAFAELNN